MSKKIEAKSDEKATEVIVYGLDSSSKPRGARFHSIIDGVVQAANDMGLKCITEPSPALRVTAEKLPEGRIYASGKAFIPNIKRDLHDLLASIVADDSNAGAFNDNNGEQATECPSENSEVACISPMTSGLPRGWDNIGVGHMVLVHEGHDNGWWESVVIKRENDILTMRFRDYPKQPIFERHINMVALVNPGPV